jgi:hypothetical protein
MTGTQPLVNKDVSPEANARLALKKSLIAPQCGTMQLSTPQWNMADMKWGFLASDSSETCSNDMCAFECVCKSCCSCNCLRMHMCSGCPFPS